tara:strand:- start:48 stop:986 length:939 start_codon:yes stop_codon:yes gene_type:complete
MSALRSWVEAARPRTLPLAVTCVLLGGALAKASGLNAAQDDRFLAVMLGAGFTVVLLQILANFANDLGDFQKGTDTAAGRNDRALASGALTETAMKGAVKGTATLAFLCGIATLIAAFWGAHSTAMKAFALGALGVFSIVAAMRYTMGRTSYGYKGLGDIYVMLFFGPVGVLGVGLLLTHGVDMTWVWVALFSGCMSVAVLNLNNLRDHASDALAGKHTLVVRMGFARAKLYHLAVLGVGWSALAIFFKSTQADGLWSGTMWYALLALLHARHAVDVWRCTDPSTLDPELKRIALSTFLVALFMFMDQTLDA